MRKRRKHEAPMMPDEGSGPLKKQSRYASEHWQPGEVPRETFVGILPTDRRITPYGQGPLAVRPPENMGEGWPKKEAS